MVNIQSSLTTHHSRFLRLDKNRELDLHEPNNRDPSKCLMSFASRAFATAVFRFLLVSLLAIVFFGGATLIIAHLLA